MISLFVGVVHILPIRVWNLTMSFMLRFRHSRSYSTYKGLKHIHLWHTYFKVKVHILPIRVWNSPQWDFSGDCLFVHILPIRVWNLLNLWARCLFSTSSYSTYKGLKPGWVFIHWTNPSCSYSTYKGLKPTPNFLSPSSAMMFIFYL